MLYKLIFNSDNKMSSVETIMEKIIDDSRFKRANFTSNELNDLAEVYERYGSAAARLFLIGKLERIKRNSSEYFKLRLLFELVVLLEDSRIPLSMAAYIIKRLNSILKIWRRS